MIVDQSITAGGLVRRLTYRLLPLAWTPRALGLIFRVLLRRAAYKRTTSAGLLVCVQLFREAEKHGPLVVGCLLPLNVKDERGIDVPALRPG